MYMLEPVIDLLNRMFESIKNEYLKATLQILFSFILFAVYLFLLFQVVDGISLIAPNKLTMIILDISAMVLVAAFLYLILFGISILIKK